jgi:hypothetical protein
MSWSLKITVFALALLVPAQATKCSDHLMALKANEFKDDSDPEACTALYSNFEKHVGHVHSMINEHLSQSFLYSVMSSHFNADAQNRLGFGKYMDELADNMWEDAIELIKYTGLRGAGMGPSVDNKVSGLRVAELDKSTSQQWSEVEALGLALDRHHEIALKVHNLHATSRDAALTGFLESRFTAKHSDRIRQLSGYLSNLLPMVQEVSSREMALYFFDQKLMA